MPYEAFANVLNKISSDYARQKKEDRDRELTRAEKEADHKRAREEREADVTSERNYQDKVRKENAEIQKELTRDQLDQQFNASLRAIRELEPLKARAAILTAAKQMGTDNADSMSDSELFTRVQEARRKEGAADILASALAAHEASTKVADLKRNDPNRAANVAADRTNRLAEIEPQIRASLEDYANVEEQLRALRTAEPALAAAPITLADMARQKAQEFITSLQSLPPKEREARLKASTALLGDFKNAAAAQAAIMADPVAWAQANHVASEDDLKRIQAGTLAALRAAGYENRPDVQALVTRLNHHVFNLTKEGFTPGVPYEQQRIVTGKEPSAPVPFFAPSAAPAAPAVPTESAPKFNLPTVPAATNPQVSAPAPAPAAPAAPEPTAVAPWLSPLPATDPSVRSAFPGRGPREIQNRRNREGVTNFFRATGSAVKNLFGPVYEGYDRNASFSGLIPAELREPAEDVLSRVRALSAADPRSPLRIELLQKYVRHAQAQKKPIAPDIAAEMGMTMPAPANPTGYWGPAMP